MTPVGIALFCLTANRVPDSVRSTMVVGLRYPVRIAADSGVATLHVPSQTVRQGNTDGLQTRL